MPFATGPRPCSSSAQGTILPRPKSPSGRMDSLAASLERSPELFPHALNVGADSVSLIRLSESDYARASFLDARILTRQTIGRTVPWPQLQSAVDVTQLEESCSYIFHIGHVGSTLLSRLLGAHRQVFALREPAILCTLAQMRADQGAQPRRWSDAEFAQRLTDFLKLWSRTFRPEQRACIKATSFVSELAAQILARPSAPKAIFMFVAAETYFASIFGGPNSRQEARMLAESRLKRLHNRLGEQRWKLATLSEGEMIAMSWACEMTALTAAMDSAGDRAMWLNFDSFLNEPMSEISAVFRHLGLQTTQAELETILSGADMHRYSKAPEHSYDAKLRREVLDQARNEHAREIRRGLDWLTAASADVSAILAIAEIGRES